MSEIVFFILLAFLPIAWIVSEFRGPRVLRITLGLLCMAVLCNAWLFSRQRNAIHNASNAAVIRLLGEAIDREDIDTVRQAINIYNHEKIWHPSGPAIDYLAEKEPANKIQP